MLFYRRQVTVWDMGKQLVLDREDALMKKIRLALCDDEHFFLKDMKQNLKKYEEETSYEIIVGEYCSGIQFLEDIKEKGLSWDIIFLDVDMPLKKGTEVAKEIRKNYEDVVICYITSFGEYALQAFEAEVLEYVVKPVDYQSLRHSLNRCIKQVQYIKDAKNIKKRYIEIQSKCKAALLCMDEIVYIEKRRNQCVFHMEDGEQVYYMTLSQAYDKLDPDMFFYSHQGYIVNFSHIKEVKTNAVCLGNGIEVPISRTHYKKLRKMHMDKIHKIRTERKNWRT